MSLLAQHGYAKSDKLEAALEAQSIQGGIFSPRDEDPARLAEYLNSLRAEHADSLLFFDPQTHAGTIPNAREGHLTEYSYFRSGLSRRTFLSSTNTAAIVSAALDFQLTMPLSGLIASTVPIDDFQDQWAFIALAMAEEAVAWKRRTRQRLPLFISVVISEAALRVEASLNEFLDSASLLETDGFYVVVDRARPEYSQQIHEASLKGLLHLVHTLGTLNERRVICGFTDFLGLPLHAVGAEMTACGWHAGLRHFSMDSRFAPKTSTGGSRPRPRYTSKTLLNSILINPELAAIHAAGRINDVLSRTSHDAGLRRDPLSTWPDSVSTLHHWEVLSQLFEEVSRVSGVSNRLALVQRKIASASQLYQAIRRVPFEPRSGPAHLQQWERGITEFKRMAGLR